MKKTKNEIDELRAEIVGYKKLYIMRVRYIFESDKAIACYEEIESDDEIFLKNYFEEQTKNVVREGNKLMHEWTDDFFEEKGKGCSKKEIKRWLKFMGYKIKK